MSQKKSSINSILEYLSYYSDEQLDFLNKLLEIYSSGMVNKSQIMSLIMTEEESRKCDTALPHDYVMRIKELLPCFDTFNYVYDYNEPNTFGTMKNLFEGLHLKMHTVLNNSNFVNNENSLISINIVEAASELAENQIKAFFQGQIYQETPEGTIYTEEAQTVFNELYDEFTELLLNIKN